MDLKTVGNILELYKKIKELEFRCGEARFFTEDFCKRSGLTAEAKERIVEIASADINKQLEECMGKLDSIKLVSDKKDCKGFKIIEAAEALQKYCKERDCVGCAFAKSNGDCSICKLPDCWDIPNEQV